MEEASMKIRLSAALAALGLVAGLALGLGASTPVLAAEKVVNVYNWSDYIEPSVLEDFTKETGIKVVYDTYDSNDILQTKLLAGKTGYDIVVPTTTYLTNEINAGVIGKLDKKALKNYGNLDKDVMARLAKYDPGNEHAIPYLWGTTGIGYNVAKMKERMGDAPVDSWKIIFDPELLKKFADCGVTMLDAQDEILPAALNYLGLNPDSKDPKDLKKAEDLIMKVRPYVRKFHSSQYINDMANGEICLAVGWSGDFGIAKTRAAEAKNGVEVGYAIPKEGALMWIDSLNLTADAPNRENALIFLDYLMRPETIAKTTNFVSYPNGNAASRPLVNKEISEDPLIYPPADVFAKLYTITPSDQKTLKLFTKIWTSIKGAS
jgi:putrescine transport system substrate-binding protein